MSSPLSVFLVDPGGLSRDGLRLLLAAEGVTVTGGAPSATAALASVAAGKADVILVDQAAIGWGALAGLRAAAPGARVVVLAAALDRASLVAALGDGADGYLLRSISPAALVQAMRLALTGERVLPSQVPSVLASPAAPGPGGLSAREREVLALLVTGIANKEIAHRLGTRVSTVKVHVKSLLRKLGVANRTQAALWALGQGFGATGAGSAA